ncbi:hypothetical protein M5K25_004549 [Dendrobium thyrsiflorum]|uniref:Uncharacterized protein n=1 Tax=Dendrobium thyrsiflorum TaxID=117978 RepID=A0ABD0VTR1_DENTH
MELTARMGLMSLLQQRSALWDVKGQIPGVYGLRTDSWTDANWSGRLPRCDCYACWPLKECLEWWDYVSHRRHQTVAGKNIRGIETPVSGGGSAECRALAGGQAERHASGDCPAERWASGGCPEERRASGGGPAERRASSGGPAERRALGGGPAALRVQVVVRQNVEPQVVVRQNVVVRRHSGVRWWFGRTSASGGGQAERRASGGGPAEHRASDGGPAERRASGGGPAEPRALGGGPAERRALGSGPAVVRQNSDGGRGGARRQERSSISLLIPSGLGSPYKRNGGSIYRFSRVAWLVNR